MHVVRSLALVASILPQVLGQALPLKTSSRWILDNNDQRVKFRCANWAGHMEVNLPEGLNKKSIEYIADWVHAQGFNCVRLTYSIDHALHPGLAVADSFAAASAASGASLSSFTSMYNDVVVHNPSLKNSTTRDAFGAVIDALWERGVVGSFFRVNPRGIDQEMLTRAHR
jgi:endoglucanase